MASERTIRVGTRQRPGGLQSTLKCKYDVDDGALLVIYAVNHPPDRNRAD